VPGTQPPPEQLTGCEHPLSAAAHNAMHAAMIDAFTKPSRCPATGVDNFKRRNTGAAGNIATIPPARLPPGHGMLPNMIECGRR
jgi:hypothetical protein